MKNYWIKVKGQWRAVGDTSALKAALEKANEDLTSLSNRVDSAIDDIAVINEALDLDGNSSGNSISQQVKDLAEKIPGLENKDTELSNSITELRETLGIIDDSGNPTEKNTLDELTECCNQTKETITDLQTTVNDITDTDKPDSIASQLNSKAEELQSNIDSLSSKYDSSISQLETVVGLSENDGQITSRFDDIATEQATQNVRLSALENTVGLGDSGSEGSSITEQVSNISDILGLTEDEEGNPYSEVLKNAQDCCSTTKEALEKLNDPEDPDSIAKQLDSLKSELESSISANTDEIENLKATDEDVDKNIKRLYELVGADENGEVGEDASIAAKVGNLSNEIKDIKDNIGELPEDKSVTDLITENTNSIKDVTDDIGNWTNEKTIAEAVEALDTCCEDSKTLIDELRDDVGEVPEGKNLYQLTADNKQSIDDINALLGVAGEEGDGETTPLTTQIDNLQKDVENIQTTIGELPEDKTVIDLITENTTSIETITSSIGEWTGEKTMSDTIAALGECCEESKEKIGEVPEDKNLYQLTVDNADEISSLKDKDTELETSIAKIKTMLGGDGEEGEDASLTVQVANLRDDVDGINSNIGNWTNEKTIAEAIGVLDECCTNSSSRLDDVEANIGEVPEGKNLYQLTADNAAAISEINENLGSLDLGENGTISSVLTDITDKLGNVPEDSNIQEQITNLTNLVGTVSGEITATHEERLGNLQEQVDATDTTVAGITTTLTTYGPKIESLESQATAFDTRITENAANIASNAEHIAALQEDVDGKIPKEGDRGSLKGFEQVSAENVTTAEYHININSPDTTVLTATANALNLRFDPSKDVQQSSVKVIAIENKNVVTALDIRTLKYDPASGQDIYRDPTWCNGTEQPDWGTDTWGLLILVAHFIAGTVVLSTFHNSEGI